MKINVGFEFETQFMSMALKDKDGIIYLPLKHFKRTLKDTDKVIVQLYPDEFTRTTAFYKQKVEPFIQSNNVQNYLIDYNFFNHTEFIVTYPKNDEIPCSSKSILNFILEKMKDGILEIQNIMRNNFSTSNEITITDFPYTHESKYRDIVLFYRQSPNQLSSKYKFMIQCTIGIHLYTIPKILKILTNAFLEYGGNLKYDIMEKTQSYSDHIFKKYRWHTNPNIMKPFLFMLFYSALTSYNRKKQALFVIRMTMTEFSKMEINIKDIDLILKILFDDFLLDPIRMYISNILTKQTRYQMLKQQNLLDTTCIPYNKNTKMILVEFRGWNRIIGSSTLNDLLMMNF